MTEITHEMLSDRMPEVARGEAAWSTAEAAHLAGCIECSAEWQLVGQGTRLGLRVAREIDVGAVAAAVTHRLATERPGRRIPAPLWLGLAAAAAITVVVLRSSAPALPVTTVAEARFLPELDSLTTEELTLMAEGLDAPLTDTELIEGDPLESLDSMQLERVLRSLEG